MAQEIERKWFVTGFPKTISPDEEYIIKQDYLIAEEYEVRLRRAVPVKINPNRPIMSEYKMTIKGPGTHNRNEIELELLRRQYELLMEMVKGKSIYKDYCGYFRGGKKIEISYVDDSWFYAEVEFKDEQEMEDYHFPWPEIVIKEVTEDKNYKMKNYWNFKNKE